MTPRQIRWLCHALNTAIAATSLTSKYPWLPLVLSALSFVATEYWHKNHRANQPASKPTHSRDHHPHKR